MKAMSPLWERSSGFLWAPASCGLKYLAPAALCVPVVRAGLSPTTVPLFCHLPPGLPEHREAAAVPAEPVLAGLRAELRPELPAGGRPSPHPEPAAGPRAGCAAPHGRPAPPPPRLPLLRAAQRRAPLWGLPGAAGWRAGPALTAGPRPGRGLCCGRPGGRGPHQPGLPDHLGGRGLLDAAHHLLHPAGHLHAR